MYPALLKTLVHVSTGKKTFTDQEYRAALVSILLKHADTCYSEQREHTWWNREPWHILDDLVDHPDRLAPGRYSIVLQNFSSWFYFTYVVGLVHHIQNLLENKLKQEESNQLAELRGRLFSMEGYSNDLFLIYTLHMEFCFEVYKTNTYLVQRLISQLMWLYMGTYQVPFEQAILSYVDQRPEE